MNYRIRLAASALLVLSLHASVAQADIEITLQIPPDQPQPVQRIEVIHDATGHVNRNREALAAYALAEIGSRITVNQDFILRDFVLQLGTFTGVHHDTDRYVFMARDSEFWFTSTVPGPTSRGMDPRFQARFDLQVEVLVKMPSNSDPEMRVRDATAVVTRVELDGKNLAGDIAVAAAAVVQFFGERATGRDLLADAIGDKLTFSLAEMIQARLQPANAVIVQQLATTGVRISGRDYDAARQVTRVHLVGLSTQVAPALTGPRHPVPRTPSNRPGDITRPRSGG